MSTEDLDFVPDVPTSADVVEDTSTDTTLVDAIYPVKEVPAVTINSDLDYINISMPKNRVLFVYQSEDERKDFEVIAQALKSIRFKYEITHLNDVNPDRVKPACVIVTTQDSIQTNNLYRKVTLAGRFIILYKTDRGHPCEHVKILPNLAALPTMVLETRTKYSDLVIKAISASIFRD